MQGNLYDVEFCFLSKIRKEKKKRKEKKRKNKKSKIFSWVHLTVPSQNDEGDQNTINSKRSRVKGVACA